MGTAKADHKAIDTDIHLETDNGNLIKIDSDNDKWSNWLENNSSFKFVAGFGGEDSYRARKEVLGGVVYWYAFKKVNGKLHKRYIGKPHEVTHNRLCEVAKSIRDVKVKPAKEDKANNDSNQIGNTNLQGIVNQLVNQVQELSNRLDNLENKGDDTTTKKLEYLPSEELEAKIQELTNELTNKDSNLSELTIQLHEVKIEAKVAKNDATLLNQEVQRLTNELTNKDRELQELTSELANEQVKVSSLSKNLQHRENNFPYSLEYLKQFGDFYINALRHKEKLPSSEVEQYKVGARKFINFIEVNKQVPGPAGGVSYGMDFDLRRGEDIVSLSSCLNELSNELTNKDSKLIELSNELTNKDSKLIELSNELTNKDSQLQELTNELANKDRELQELKAAIPPAVVPNPQSPITNHQSPPGEDVESDSTDSENKSDTQSPITDEEQAEKNRQSHEEYVQKYLTPKPEKQRLDPAIYTRNYQIVSMLECQFWMDGKNFNNQELKDNGIDKNLADNKAEIESMLGIEVNSKDKIIQRLAKILRAMGFELKGNQSDGFYIVNPELFN